MSGARVLLLVVVTALALGGAYLARPALFEGRLRTSTKNEAAGSSAFDDLARSPTSAEAWLRLGDEAQREGQLPLARAAFRAAQELAPDDGTAHARLGFVLYEEGEDQAALVELQRAREKGSDAALLDFTLSMMRAHVDTAGPFPRFSGDGRKDAAEPARDDDGPATLESGQETAAGPHARSDDEADDGAGDGADDEVAADEPSTVAGEGDRADDDAPRAPHEEEEDAPEGTRLASGSGGGACELELERKSAQGIFLIDALVNGVQARLIVDTGASLTVLSRGFLEDTGLALHEDGVLTARTAAGPQRFSTAGVRSVEIGERVVSDVRVAICEDCGMPGSDGLLGLDVQEPLGMSLFPSRGSVRFADCFE